MLEKVSLVDFAECIKISFACIHKVGFTTSWAFFRLVKDTKIPSYIFEYDFSAFEQQLLPVLLFSS
jgi:hypothetical protein